MVATRAEVRTCIDRLQSLQASLDIALAQAQQVRHSFERALRNFAASDESLIVCARLLGIYGDEEEIRHQRIA